MFILNFTINFMKTREKKVIINRQIVNRRHISCGKEFLYYTEHS